MDPAQLEMLTGAFREQLVALPGRVCAGTTGTVFRLRTPGAEERGWPEAARLRELALALQSILAQQESGMHCAMSFSTCARFTAKAIPVNAAGTGISWADRKRRGGREARGGEKGLIILRTFLALLAGFATMAVLVMVITALLR